MEKFFQEFKSFALKGNVMDLAVAVIIGAAFQSVVTSFTTNIISPIIGAFGGKNFDTMQLNIGGISIGYGAFITSVINFLIMAFVVFLLVKSINKLVTSEKKDVAEVPTTKECPYCFSEIHIKASKCPSCTSQLKE